MTDFSSQGAVVIDKKDRLHYLPGNHAAGDYHLRSNYSITDKAFVFDSDQAWSNLGLITPDTDFSYDTPVVDDENIYFSYRQRLGGYGRGLVFKGQSVDSNEWNSDLGKLVVKPPHPYDHKDGYMIHYHKMNLDRQQNIHISSSFLEFDHRDRWYPRVSLLKLHNDTTWSVLDRYQLLENIIGGKIVQKIYWQLKESYSISESIELNATSNNSEAKLNYEVLEGSGKIDGDTLRFNSKGVCKVKVSSSSNNIFYADEKVFNIKLVD